MIIAAIAFLGLPDLRTRDTLHIITTPAGFHITVNDETCQTPCDVHPVTGARITFSIAEPGWTITKGRGPKWTHVLDPIKPYRLSPDTLDITLAPTGGQ